MKQRYGKNRVETSSCGVIKQVLFIVTVRFIFFFSETQSYASYIASRNQTHDFHFNTIHQIYMAKQFLKPRKRNVKIHNTHTHAHTPKNHHHISMHFLR